MPFSPVQFRLWEQTAGIGPEYEENDFLIFFKDE